MLRVGFEPYPVVVAFERITVDPAQMGGLPCIRGMRVTVSMEDGWVGNWRGGSG